MAENLRLRSTLCRVFNHPLTHVSGDMEILIRSVLPHPIQVAESKASQNNK